MVFVNDAFSTMFDVHGTTADLVGRRVTEDLRAAPGASTDKPERFAIDVDATYAAGEPRTFELTLADGRVLEARYMPVHDLGVTTGHLWVYRDISARRRRERVKDEHLARVSHELRTPLTSVMSFTDLLLEDDGIGPSQRAMLEVVRRNADRLHRQVHELLLHVEHDSA